MGCHTSKTAVSQPLPEVSPAVNQSLAAGEIKPSAGPAEDRALPEASSSASTSAPETSSSASTSAPGKPPGRPPPPGKAPPSKPPGKPKDQPSNPLPDKSAVSAGSLADALSQKRTNLRKVQTDPGPSLVLVDGGSLSPEEEVRERTTLLDDLRALAASTTLGMVESVRVEVAQVESETPALGNNGPALGRGRFASVMRAYIIDVADVGPGRAKEQISVAAKRFATKAPPVNDVGVAFPAAHIPLSALRSARSEAQALSIIGPHPNVVSLLGIVVPSPDLGAAHGNQESLTPLQLLLSLSSGSLFDLLANRARWTALGRHGRLMLLRDVACGLEVIHAAGYAHLDVKSHNVVVDCKADDTWVARLCDFGSAYGVNSGKPPPPAGGTSGWTAPEILGPPAALELPDHRLADVFSFGVLIWAVSSGPGANNPLCGLCEDDFGKALISGQRPVFPLDASEEEVTLAAKCWQYDARCRPSMADVAQAVIALENSCAPFSPDSSRVLQVCNPFQFWCTQPPRTIQCS